MLRDLFKKMRYLDGSRRPHPCGGDHLSEMGIRHLARDKNARHVCFHHHVGSNITGVVHIQLPGEHLGVGSMPDKNKNAVSFDFGCLASLSILHFDRLNDSVPLNFSQSAVPYKADLGVGECPVLEDLAGSK